MLNGRPLKAIKNKFHFILNALSFLRYLNFCLDLFSHVRKRQNLFKDF